MLSLAIALQGPMMSFSLSSHEREKATQLMPTKSAIVGLMACCLGRRRDEELSDLAALKMHIRVDAEGMRMQDFHTIGNALRANGQINDDQFVSLRDYLVSAAFLVVVSGEATLISQVAQALRNPRFVPYLGRRTCFPARPLFIQEPSTHSAEELMTALDDLTGTGGIKTIWLEEEARDAVAVFDQPMTGRRFGRRMLRSSEVELAPGYAQGGAV